MGKFLVGCVVVIFVLAVAAGGVGYFFFVKPAVDFGQDAVRFTQEFQKLDEQVEHRQPYQPPEDRRVTEQQFERFLAAQSEMRTRMEGRLTELRDKYQEMEEQIEAEGRDLRIRELMEGYQGLAELLLDARRSQVDAMNRHAFSPQEYAWVRGQVYQAIGESVAVGMGQMTQEQQAARPDRAHPDTVAMVEPYREELMQGHVLAWWGF